jgi:hypothetical protein
VENVKRETMKTRITTLLIAGLLLAGCSQSTDNSGGTAVDSRDESTFKSSVGRTCNRLGLAFSQTDVTFLLEELATAISGTGYSNSEALDELRAQCNSKLVYADALP